MSNINKYFLKGEEIPLKLLSKCESNVLQMPQKPGLHKSINSRLYPDLNLLFDKLIESRIERLSIYDKEWWMADDVAIWLSISIGTVRNWTSDGKLPHTKIHGLVRYHQDTLRKLFMAEECQRGVSYGY